MIYQRPDKSPEPTISVVVDTSGNPTDLILHQNGIDQTAWKIKETLNKD